MRFSLRVGIPIILIIIFVVAVVVMNARQREGLTDHKSKNPEYSERMGLPTLNSDFENIPSEKEEKVRFPGVPWGNKQEAQSIMPSASKVPSAPSALLEQVLGYLQPLGSAPDESVGIGASVKSKGDGEEMNSVGNMERLSADAAGLMPGDQGEGGFHPSSYDLARGGYSGGQNESEATHRGRHVSPQSALPRGIPKSQIPKGQEDLYILKTEIVPPVCPACPACPECPRPVCPKPDDSQCPPCPAPGRCPPSSFSCQRVPLYQNMNSGVLPSYLN